MDVKWIGLYYSSNPQVTNSAIYIYVCMYVYIFIVKVFFKRPLSPTMSFLPCRIEGPLFDTGVSCGAPCAAARGLAPCCPTHAQSQRHHRCTFGEPACTGFGCRYGRRMPLQLYGQQMPLQLRFFAIALQSKVRNAVQYFCIGPHFVPKRDIKRCLLKTAFPMNTYP